MPEYIPRGAAQELFGCRAPEVLIEGPAGTGKSRSVLEKIHAVCDKYPGARALIARATRASMSETVLVTWEKIVLGDGHPLIGNASRSHRLSYEYPNGSTVVVGGLDNPDRLMSSEYDIAAVFEATEITLEDWEKVCTRVRNGVVPYQQAIADCNPSHPGHWLNTRAMDPAVMVRLLSRHDDNPKVTEAYLRRLANLSGARRARLFEGRWVGAEGVVYDRFDKAVHVARRDGPWADTIIGVDDGYTNAFCALLVRIDGDGRLHVEREHYQSKSLMGDRVGAIKAMGAYPCVVDPAAASLIADLRANGVHVYEADNAVRQGIYRVQDRMLVQADGKPRLTVDPSCVNVIAEFESYRWKENRSAMSDDGRYQDEPAKENDHAMDALRYAVMRVDGQTRSSVVFMEPEQSSKDRRQAWLSGDDF